MKKGGIWPPRAKYRLLASHCLSVVLGAGLAISAMSGPALACECNPLTPVQAIGSTPFIFSGQVVGVEHDQPSIPANLVATITVHDRWKGDVGKQVRVHGNTSSASCGYSEFPVGQTMTVMAYPVQKDVARSSEFVTNACLMGVLYEGRAAMPGLLERYRTQHDRVDAAVAAAPGAVAPLLDRARMLEGWNDPAAIGAYARVATLAPDLEAAQLGLARVQYQQRHLADARTAVARALALAASDPEAIRLDLQLRILAGDTTMLGTLRDLHGLTIPSLELPGHDLRRWDLRDAQFGYLALVGADLRDADMQNLKAYDAHLAEARLDGASMAGVQLSSASLTRASLRGVLAPNASFTRADLSGALLDGASLPGADFRNAKLIGASLERTNLAGANLASADLDGADLSRANLRGADLRGAFYGCKTRLPGGLTPEAAGMLMADPSLPVCH